MSKKRGRTLTIRRAKAPRGPRHTRETIVAHEMSHAGVASLVGLPLEYVDVTPHKVMRGGKVLNASGGAAIPKAEQDKRLAALPDQAARAWLEDYCTMLAAGPMSDQVFAKLPADHIGASDDIRRLLRFAVKLGIGSKPTTADPNIRTWLDGHFKRAHFLLMRDSGQAWAAACAELNRRGRLTGTEVRALMGAA